MEDRECFQQIRRPLERFSLPSHRAPESRCYPESPRSRASCDKGQWDRAHDILPPPSGNVVTLNISFGLTVPAFGPLFLLYGSLSLVTDSKGGVELFTSGRDQEWPDEFVLGPAQKEKPSGMLALGGADLTYGVVYGENFQTGDFGGAGYDYALNVGYVALGSSENLAETWDSYYGGVSVGGPFTMGTVATNSTSVFGRLQLPEWAIGFCHALGQCGMYPLLPVPEENLTDWERESYEM